MKLNAQINCHWPILWKRYHQNSANVMRVHFNCHKMRGHGQSQKIEKLTRIGPQSPTNTNYTNDKNYSSLSPLRIRIRSSRTVQQMQPLFIDWKSGLKWSTERGVGQIIEGKRCDRRHCLWEWHKSSWVIKIAQNSFKRVRWIVFFEAIIMLSNILWLPIPFAYFVKPS